MASGVIAELRRGGAHALKAVQRLVQTEHIETALAPELLRLATSNDTDVSVPSFLAFAKLCGNADVPSQSPSTFSATDVALVVSDQLQSPDIRMQAAATLALTNLTTHNLALDSTILSRVVDALEADDAHEGIQRALLGYIGNASAVPDASRGLLEDTNCMQVLAELLQAGRGESLRSAAALTIGNILSTRDVMAQNQLREVGALPELVLLLSSMYAPETNESSAWALSHGVHLNVLSQDLVGDAGAVGLLLKLVLSHDDDVRRNAVMALHSTAVGHAANLARCKKNHGQDIVQDLLHDDVTECRTYASLLLEEM